VSLRHNSEVQCNIVTERASFLEIRVPELQHNKEVEAIFFFKPKMSA